MIRSLALSLFLAVTAAALPAQSLLYNGGFEKGDEGWFPFVPSEAKDAGATFTIISGEACSGNHAARIDSSSMTRHGFSIRGSRAAIPVVAGERYRITAWVRVDAATLVRPGTPGPVVRITPLTADKKDVAAGSFFINADNLLTRGDVPPAPKAQPLEWTKLEAVLEVPSDASYLLLFFCGWYSQGPIYFDDIEFEKVPVSTPLTAIARR